MGMNIGPNEGMRSEINITPLVDVVLVLLIIFMVVTPMLQMGYDVKVPPKATDIDTSQPQPATTDQVIIRYDVEGRIYLNSQIVSDKDFPLLLEQQVQGREGRVVFFSADGEANYEKVLQFMDLCREYGATNLGIVLEEPTAPGAQPGEGGEAATEPA